MHFLRFAFIAATVIFLEKSGWSQGSVLDQLKSLHMKTLVEHTMERGDAKRGAILFHQAHMQCAKCHATGAEEVLLGPTLIRYDKKVERQHVLESIMHPSKTIREGYRTVVVITDEGNQLTGLLESDQSGTLVIRDATGSGRRVSLKKYDLEEIVFPNQSLMPEGLVNQMTSTSQFYDLAKYVIEIAEQGSERALELQPATSVVQLPPLPEYEQQIDHAGLIATLDDEAFQRGQRIYNRVCANCHGTHTREGSLPTAPRFASGKLKNGSDPFRLYQTLTHGFGLMIPQRWMVPKQKYDVIHYIREAYFKEHNPSFYVNVADSYLASLPQGDSQGPDPVSLEHWAIMDYGSTMMHTFEIALNNTSSEDDVGWDLGVVPDSDDPWANPDEYFQPGGAPNFAYKGIAVRLDSGPGGISRGTHWVVYDHDTLNMHAAWRGTGFIDFSNIQFDGKHSCHSRLTGEIVFENSIGPGWAQPLTGVFADPRPVGRDGRFYGPLPRSWAKYRGLYHYGQKAILSYSVGSAQILELPDVITSNDSPDVFARQISIGPASHPVSVLVGPDEVHMQLRGSDLAEVVRVKGKCIVRLPARDEITNLQILVSDRTFDQESLQLPPLPDLVTLTSGSPARWPERVRTTIQTVHDDLFAVDDLSLPIENPWNCRVRATGHDFFSDGRQAAVCTWDGDVWIVEGIDQDQGELVWQRIASGLFQPLGLKIVDGQIFVTCRDQLVVLRDLNGDRETDFYQCFNNDHQVTEHFHEFAMGLQVDGQGNFYYAKSARHARRAVVPHHGTLLRVTPDGSRTDILATGFRAANGVCLNPDGSFFVTDQEGHWNPKNRINWVTEGGFYGNMYGFTDVTDSADDAMFPPMCWITNRFDRSPAELLWVPQDCWGPLGGSLLNLSYGYGSVYIVPHERVGDVLQGGMCRLPIPHLPSGAVRGRFHAKRGDLFVSSMFSWAGSQQVPGGFHRVRYSHKPAYLPVGLSASPQRLRINFSHDLDRKTADEAGNYKVTAWDIRRTPNYGSDHFDERRWKVSSAALGQDGRTVELTVPQLETTWCMSIEYKLRGANGRTFDGEIHNTIHRLLSAENRARSDNTR